MSNTINAQLLKTIQLTSDWSRDLEERWTGTLVERILMHQRTELDYAVRKRKIEKARNLVKSLIYLCGRTEEDEQ